MSNVVRGGVVHLFFTREAPIANGRKDFDLRVKRVAGDFDAHLVLPFAGAAVGDGDGSLFLGAPDERLGDHRTREGRVERIYSLIYGVSLERRPDESIYKGLAEIDDVSLRRAGSVSLSLDVIKVVGLLATDVSSPPL